MNILLVGGGSGGPVSPLLAVAEEIKTLRPQARFLLLGTRTGPEGLMAKKAGIAFQSISAGKFKRYMSFSNFAAPFFVMKGFFQALGVIKRFHPKCVFGAGSFVQVPVVWAAWVLRVPVIIHQQDILPSLANVICQIPAKKITVTFEDSLQDFHAGLGLFYKKNNNKIVFTGNPFRTGLKNATKEEAIKFFNLRSDMPTLLVLGGGTGALFINTIIETALPVLAKSVQIIHSTGGRGGAVRLGQEHYHPYEFISQMGLAYAAADMVISRAGLSTITELSNLRKLSIIVPIPNSHQELNALKLLRHKAAVVVTQDRLTAESLVRLVRRLLFEHMVQEEMKENISKIMPKGSAKKIADIVISLSP